MPEEKELRLKVGELTAREEAGRGIVRIDANTMAKLGVKEGDVVEIEGSKKTGAIAVRAYPADVGLNIIRMDGITRRNAGSGVGEIVKIRKANVKEGRRVTIAPAEKGIIIHVSPSLLKQNLYMRPVTKGDIIIPSPVIRRRQRGGSFFEDFFGMDFEEFFFTPFPGETRFVVTNTEPSGIVRIGDITDLEILSELPEAMKLEERVIPAVTYEDVGGIKEIIHKVREMIELPLRHPELFERLGVEPPKGVLLYGPPGTGKTLLAKAVANESGANFISISGPEIFSKWYGQSLPFNEKIFVIQNGKAQIKNIGEVVKEQNAESVIAFDPNGKAKFSKISNFVQHPLSPTTKILEVKTSTGRKIRVTDYHSLFTINEGKIQAVKTSELVPNKSYVAIPSKIPVHKAIKEINLFSVLKDNDLGLKVRNSKMVKKAVKKLGIEKVAELLEVKERYVYDLINKNISLPLKKFEELMEKAKINFNPKEVTIAWKKESNIPALLEFDADLSFLIGIWLAEGDYNGGAIRIHNSLPEVKEIVKKFCKKFNIHATFYKDTIVINSTPLRIIFENIFGLKSYAREKTIPSLVFSLEKSSLQSLLKGYFSGDGSIYQNQRGVYTIEATTYSEKLASDLMYLLLYFGIVASHISDRKGNRHRILIRGMKNFRKFKKIGFIDKLRNKKIVKYLQSRKLERSDQIPIWDELRSILASHLKEWKNSRTIGRDKLIGLLKKVDPSKQYFPDIWKIAEADIFWDKVKSVVPIEYNGEVFDVSVNPTENFVAGFGGIFAHNTEENLRKIFEEAEKNAPSIIFIDEIDAIAPKREEVVGEVERRTVAQLLALMDGLKKRGKVIVIAATNRPHSLDPALRRAGRFDREIEFPVPDRNGRLEILKIHTRNMPLAKDVDLEHLADITYGYVGADIWALCKEAAMSALRRVLPEIKWKEEEELPREVMEKLVVTKEDFENALKLVEPSAMREVLVEIPKVKWEDIGGLEDVKQSLKEMIEWPLKHPESFEKLGIQPPKGILLYGPPGCGKTLLAKAVANESGANFISIKGPEVLSMWVGESERKIREIFRRARQVAPAIIFLDEIDALAPRRGIYAGTRVTETVVSQLLTEISGLEELKNVVIIAATNRPDIVDPALLRPGRIDRFVLIPPPDEKARLEILKVHTKKMPLKGVDLKEWARKTEGFSGADIEALCREAAMNALRENIKAKEVREVHFEEAFKKMTPSISKEVVEHYNRFVERTKRIKKEEEVSPFYIG